MDVSSRKISVATGLPCLKPAIERSSSSISTYSLRSNSTFLTGSFLSAIARSIAAMRCLSIYSGSRRAESPMASKTNSRTTVRANGAFFLSVFPLPKRL